MASSSNLAPSPLGPPVAEKLTRDNFVLWKAQFLPAIRGAQLMGILDGSSPAPPKVLSVEKDGKAEEKPNPAYEVWVARDQQLLGHLLNSINKEVLAQVATLTTSAEVWATLEGSFAAQSHARVTNLRLQLANLKKGNMKMAAYLAKMKNISDEIASAGKTVDADDMVG